MQVSFKVVGLKSALNAMTKAFPKNPEQQRKLLNQALSGAARQTIIPMAKSLALQGDGSGALSESIKPRAVRKSRALAKGVAASVEITPVRSDRRAMARYINYYYTSRGKVAPADLLTSGIRHGHLVEFGSKNNAARPFLWPALQAQARNFQRAFGRFLKKKTEAAVRRAAKRKAKK